MSHVIDRPNVKRHPAAIAEDAFIANNPTLLRGSASGEYLENRLRQAFSEGWAAAAKAAKAGLSEPK